MKPNFMSMSRWHQVVIICCWIFRCYYQLRLGLHGPCACFPPKAFCNYSIELSCDLLTGPISLTISTFQPQSTWMSLAFLFLDRNPYFKYNEYIILVCTRFSTSPGVLLLSSSSSLFQNSFGCRQGSHRCFYIRLLIQHKNQKNSTLSSKLSLWRGPKDGRPEKLNSWALSKSTIPQEAAKLFDLLLPALNKWTQYKIMWRAVTYLDGSVGVSASWWLVLSSQELVHKHPWILYFCNC